MSETLIVSSFNNSSTSTSKMTVRFPYPQEFKNKRIALSQLIMPYSFFNITSLYGNNTFSYKVGGVDFPITIPDGFYSVSDIQGFFEFTMKANGHYLVDSDGTDIFYIRFDVNLVVYGITLTATPVPASLPAGWTNPAASLVLDGFVPQLVVPSTTFGNLIGFPSQTFPVSATETTTQQANNAFVGQISPTTAILLHCNLVTENQMSNFPDVIKAFVPNVSFGNYFTIEPSRLDFNRIADGKYSFLELSFTDQLNRPLDVKDLEASVISVVIADN